MNRPEAGDERAAGGGGPVARRRRSRPHDEEEHENHERWMVSYADMVTLLMCLFIVMFAISQVDQKKFAELGAGLSSSFGAPMTLLNSGSTTADEGVGPDPVDIHTEVGVDQALLGQAAPARSPDATATPSRPAQAEVDRARAVENQRVAEREFRSLLEARRRLHTALKKAGYERVARYRIDQRGLTVSIVSDRVLFASAQAHLRPEGVEVLHVVGPVLRSLPNDLVIEGHTDRLPLAPGSAYPSNWELSVNRATRVLRYLAGREGVPEPRLSAAGYAWLRPLVPGHGPDALRLNRRVDVVVLSTAPAESNALLPQLAARHAAPEEN